MAIRESIRSVLRRVGSLWFAAVLLLLLMVSMGAGTVCESMDGTELARRLFYHAPWFRILLMLLAVNVGAALQLRYPFRRGHLPFVVAHAGILLTLAGALVSERFGIDGQLLLTKGVSRDQFRAPGEVLSLSDGAGSEVHVDLARSLGRGLDRVEAPASRDVTLGGLRVEVLLYLPDVIREQRITDDSEGDDLALEVALVGGDDGEIAWVFPGQHAELGGLHVHLQRALTPEAWQALLKPDDDSSRGSLHIEVPGGVVDMAMEACAVNPVPVADTAFKIKVLRYLPHAIVGPSKTIVNASDEPVNPAVEVEISGPGGTDTRLAFANFPDFHGRMGETKLTDVKVTFISTATASHAAPIELLCGPDGRLAVRFAAEGALAEAHELRLGAAIPTPWPGKQLKVIQRFEHARVGSEVVEQVPVRAARQPALQVRVSGPEGSEDIWLEKQQSLRLAGPDGLLQVSYGDRMVPLGFQAVLNEFRIGYYPGRSRPRSFESSVRITNPATGHDQNVVISMNRPASYAGYTLYQSSYQRQGQEFATVLSVARDPGRPIVFLGYAATMAGMALLIGMRVLSRQDRKQEKPL